MTQAAQTKDTTKEAQPDGRRAWRDRNRLAVVDALLDFYAEGNLRPGAQAVAERSGVSRRSVFRYFEDLDDLDRTAIARQQERVRHLIELPDLGEGALNDRIERIAAQRAVLYSAIAPAARVSRARAPFQRVLAEELAVSRKVLGRQVERQFQPELSAMAERERRAVFAAAEVLLSFESFDLLCATRGFGGDEIRATLSSSLRRLFAAGPSTA